MRHLTSDEVVGYRDRGEATSRVLRHLEDCAACRRRLAGYRTLETLYGGRARGAPGEHLSRDEIVAYATLSLSPSDSRRASLHLRSCDSCGARFLRYRRSMGGEGPPSASRRSLGLARGSFRAGLQRRPRSIGELIIDALGGPSLTFHPEPTALHAGTIHLAQPLAPRWGAPGVEEEPRGSGYVAGEAGHERADASPPPDPVPPEAKGGHRAPADPGGEGVPRAEIPFGPFLLRASFEGAGKEGQLRLQVLDASTLEPARGVPLLVISEDGRGSKVRTDDEGQGNVVLRERVTRLLLEQEVRLELRVVLS